MAGTTPILPGAAPDPANACPRPPAPDLEEARQRAADT